MSRARRLPAVAFALAFGCSGADAPPEPPARPDLVLVTVDTLRADHLGSYGYRLDVSPNIDRLAAQGVRFAEATVQWPSTWPSLASMLTGLYPGRSGVLWSPKRALDDRQLTLAEILRDAGYRTGAVVSNASIGRSMQFDQGFDRFVESWLEAYAQEYPGRPYRDQTVEGVKRFTNAGVVTDDAIEWLEAQPRGEPIFLWAHYMDPHGPYTPPAPYDALFEGAHPPRPIARETIPPHQLRVPPGQSEPTADLAYYVASYDREIRYLDDELARLLAALELRWQRAPGLLVFTADHGESFDEHGEILGHGLTPFRPTTRVPLLLRMPGRLPEGRVVETPIAMVDLLPTLLTLLDVEVPEHVQGRSLLPWIEGAQGTPPAVFGHAGISQPPQAFVRRGRFKLVRAEHPRDAARVGGRLALFDLEADPGETRNVIDAHPETAARLERELDAWLAANGPGATTPRGPAAAHDPLERELLHRLGYAE